MERFRRLKDKLRPSEAAKPLDPDERSPQLGLKFKDLEVMGALIEAHADLSQSREVLYYLYARNPQTGQLIADAAREHGFDANVREPLPDDPERWAVVCQKDVVLSPDFVRETTDYFEALAAERDAEYDGWEAALEGNKAQGPRASRGLE